MLQQAVRTPRDDVDVVVVVVSSSPHPRQSQAHNKNTHTHTGFMHFIWRHGRVFSVAVAALQNDDDEKNHHNMRDGLPTKVIKKMGSLCCYLYQLQPAAVNQIRLHCTAAMCDANILHLLQPQRQPTRILTHVHTLKLISPSWQRAYWKRTVLVSRHKVHYYAYALSTFSMFQSATSASGLQ